MAFLSAAQEAREYDKVPMGMHQGTLVEITEPEYYDSFPDPKTGKVKKVPKSRFIFEITHSNDTNAVGEKLSKFVNMDGRGPKSGLYAILQGLDLDPELDYEEQELIGRKAQLFVIIEKDSKKVSRSKIDKVIPIPGQPKVGRARPVAEPAATLAEARPF